MGDGINEGFQLGVGLGEFSGALADASFKLLIGACQLLVGMLQGLLSALAAGNVAGDFGSANDGLLRIFEGRNGKGDVDESAVFALADGLVMLDGFSTAYASNDVMLFVLSFAGYKHDDGVPDDFVRGVAEETFGAAIPTGNDAVKVFGDNGVLG